MFCWPNDGRMVVLTLCTPGTSLTRSSGLRAVERKVLDATVIDGHSDLCRPGVHLRRLAGDRDCFSDLTEFQHEVDAQALQRRQADARPLNRAESVRLDLGDVRPHLQLRGEVVARSS